MGADVADETIFQQSNIIIDRSLARFGTTTYPVANIGSVSIQRNGSPGKVLAVVLFIIGGLALVGGGGVIGLVLLIVGALAFFFSKPTFSIMLKTSSGDQQVLQDKNEIFVTDVKNALERAIVLRG